MFFSQKIFISDLYINIVLTSVFFSIEVLTLLAGRLFTNISWGPGGQPGGRKRGRRFLYPLRLITFHEITPPPPFYATI